MTRFPLLDGLRGLAALAVLWSHVAFWTGASGIDFSGGLLARGDAGVAVFFVLSAFLLLRPFLVGEPSLSRYARLRCARILPAYWIALVAVLLAAWWLGVPGGTGGPAKVVVHALLLQGYSNDSYQAFTQTWSLTTEATFYLLVPLLGPALRRCCDRGTRPILALLGLIAASGIVAQGISAAWSRHDPHGPAGVLGVSVLGHAAWFAVGALLAVLVSRPQAAPRLAQVLAGLRPGTLAGSAAVVYLIASSPLAGPRDLHLPSVGQAVTKEILYAVLAGLLVAAGTRAPSTARERDLAGWPGLQFVGELSYAVFLWHVLVLQVLYAVTGRPLFSGGFGWMMLAVVTITGMIAWASWSWVEGPILRAAHRRAPSRQPAPQR